MANDDRPNTPTAIVTGSTAGLGLSIAEHLLKAGYRTVITGRNADRLTTVVDRLSQWGEVTSVTCDVTKEPEVQQLLAHVSDNHGRLDVLVNCVGASDRGLVENLSTETLQDLFDRNVMTTLRCSQAAIPLLAKSAGVIVNIGSVGGRVGARYIGGYAAAKHALTGMTQQMRLELKQRGIHVGLVSPGPIKRSDAGTRYAEKIDSSLPSQASRPGGGTKVKGLSPDRVAVAVLKVIRRRKPDIILPGYLRILITIGMAFPTLGDWLLLKMTSSK